MSTRVKNELPVNQDEVDISQIFVDESRNMRRFPPPEKYLKDLAQSIDDNGQLQPVVVRRMDTNDNGGYKYALVAGYQRTKAIRRLIEEGRDMPVLVRVVDAEDTGAIVTNVTENKDRDGGSIIDLSYAIGKLKDGESTTDDEGTVTIVSPGMMLKDIAKALNIGHGYASELDKMRYLRIPIQKKIHTGEIKGVLARQLVNMTEEEQDEVLSKLEEGGDGVSQSTLAGHLSDKKKAKSKKKSRKGKGEAGDNEGEGGREPKKPISAKKAILIMEDLGAKPKAVDGEELEETQAQSIAREVCQLVRRLMLGKVGQGGFQKGLVKLIEGA